MSDLAIGINLPTTVDGEVGDPRVSARHVEDLGLESVWAADVVLGDGTPSPDSTVVLALAAAVTERLRLGFGVLALPLRPAAWVATQVATLQHLSANRVLLGVGIGGFPGSPFWHAVGAPRKERGSRTDAALEVLPGLITGEPTRLGHDESQPVVTLAPPAAVPPILVGGSSVAAIRRAAKHGDGWLPSQVAPGSLPSKVAELRELAAAHGRPAPGVTVGGHAVIGDGEAARSAHRELVRSLIDDHGVSPEDAEEIPMTARDPAELADRFTAYADAGAERVVISPEGGPWMRQCELVAEANALLQ